MLLTGGVNFVLGPVNEQIFGAIPSGKVNYNYLKNKLYCLKVSDFLVLYSFQLYHAVIWISHVTANDREPQEVLNPHLYWGLNAGIW